MPRVDEIARELGVSSEKVVERLRAMGTPVDGHTSSIDDDVAARLRRDLADGGGSDAATGTLPRSKLQQALDESIQAKSRAKPSEPGATPEPTPEDRKPPKKKGKRSFKYQLIELPVLILFAFVIAVIIKTFLAQAFFIPSSSMTPTLNVGDRVLVEKLSYRFGDPDRGDVVVFAKSVLGRSEDLPWHQDVRVFLRELLGLPTGKEEDYIKRVVALGGDTIRYAGKPRVLEINGEAVDEPYLANRDRLSQTFTSQNCRHFDMEVDGKGCVVPADSVFVMGDNRNNSQDSRVFGPVKEEKIVGRAFVIIWPPGDFGGL